MSKKKLTLQGEYYLTKENSNIEKNIYIHTTKKISKFLEEYKMLHGLLIANL